MTWLGQVRHVVAKDVRQTLWPLAGYLAFLVLATIQAMQPPVPLQGPFNYPVMYLVVVMGVFVTALVVQADSPTRSDAFWASRPFYPTAVLAAKWVDLMIVFGIGLIAQSTVFVWLGEPPIDFVRLLVRSSWTYPLWLLVGMIVASLTRDLRTFITVLAVIPLAFSFTGISSIFARQSLGAPRTAFFAAATIGAAAGVAVLVRVYRTKNDGRMSRMLATGAIACVLLGIFANPWRRSSGRFADGDNERYGLHVQLMNNSNGLDRIAVGVARPDLSNRYVVIDSVEVRFHLNDGNTLVLPGDPYAVVAFPQMPLPPGTRWLGAPPIEASYGMNGLRATRAQLDSLAVGISNVTIDFWTWSAQPSALMSLPMRTGARGRNGGVIVRVRRVGTRARGDTLASVVRTSIGTPEMWSRELSQLTYSGPSYALVNAKLGEAVIPMHSQYGGATASTPLPGLWRVMVGTDFTGGIRVYRGQPVPPVGNEWLSDANILVYEWTVMGRAHHRIENVEVRETIAPGAEVPPNATERRPPAAGTPPASRSPQTQSP